jgi:CheY-like chemotaxis protein/anti-sigma regulatory factor (Ser/Thr protein kinase)
MPVLLVVDDSPMDRKLIGGLLSRQGGDWVVEYAEHGMDAMYRMDEMMPDVIVTDLIMPKMDGIELVTSVRKNYPEIPVILTTAHGNEQLALEALDKGAASYVPKLQLNNKLVETVKQMLDVARADRSYKRLIGSLSETQFRFYVDNDPALIPPLVNLVQQMAYGMRLCDTTGRRRLGIALDEALLNAMYHGNLELPKDQLQNVRSVLREGKEVKLIQQRRVLPIYADRRVMVEVNITPQRGRFVIRDEGPGFHPDVVAHVNDPSVLEHEGGRGLVLMKNFMDEMKFNETGNEVTLVKLPDPDQDEE